MARLGDKIRYFFQDDVELDDKARKNMNKHADAPQWLAAYADLLEKTALPPSYPGDRGEADTSVVLPTDKDSELPARDARPFVEPRYLEEDARAFTEKRGIKFGHFVAPVRAALSRSAAGPGLFDIVYLLGKERCLERLRAR